MAEDKPNVIVIMVDDMGYGGLSCYDNTYFKTPATDRLAADGVRLTDFHSNGVLCSPTRAALMTGRQFARIGVPGVFGPSVTAGLPLNETTVADQLKKADYKTAIMGK